MPTKKKTAKKTNLEKVVVKKTNWLMWGGVLGVLALGGWMLKSSMVTQVGINQITQVENRELISWDLKNSANFKNANNKKITVWQPLNYKAGSVSQSGGGIVLGNLTARRGMKIFSVDTSQGLATLYDNLYDGNPIQNMTTTLEYKISMRPSWMWAQSREIYKYPNGTTKPVEKPTMTLPVTVEFYSGLTTSGKRQLLSKKTQDVVLTHETESIATLVFDNLDPYSVASLDLIRVYVDPSKDAKWQQIYRKANIVISNMSMNARFDITRMDRVDEDGVLTQEMNSEGNSTLYFTTKSGVRYMANFDWTILVPTSTEYVNPYTYLNKNVRAGGYVSEWEGMGKYINLDIIMPLDTVTNTYPTSRPVPVVDKYKYLQEPMLLDRAPILEQGVMVKESSL